jgi:hypothetical protein
MSNNTINLHYHAHEYMIFITDIGRYECIVRHIIGKNKYMAIKYNSSATEPQHKALFEHGPHIASLIIDKMAPTSMSPAEILNRYRDEQNPRPGEMFTEWALIHFGYISLKNMGNYQAMQEELTGHLIARFIPNYATVQDIEARFDSSPRVDGIATDEDLLVAGLMTFFKSTTSQVQTPELLAA